MFVYQYLCFLLGIAMCWYPWRWPRCSHMISHAIYVYVIHASGRLAKMVAVLERPESYDIYATKKDPVTYDKFLRAVTAYSHQAHKKALNDSKLILRAICEAWLILAIPCVVLAIGALPYLLVGFVSYFAVRLTKAYLEELRTTYPFVSIVMMINDCLDMYDKKTNTQEEQ